MKNTPTMYGLWHERHGWLKCDETTLPAVVWPDADKAGVYRQMERMDGWEVRAFRPSAKDVKDWYGTAGGSVVVNGERVAPAGAGGTDGE